MSVCDEVMSVCGAEFFFQYSVNIYIFENFLNIQYLLNWNKKLKLQYYISFATRIMKLKFLYCAFYNQLLVQNNETMIINNVYA